MSALAQLEEAMGASGALVRRVPVLVKGQLRLAPPIDLRYLRAQAHAQGSEGAPAQRFAVDGAWVLRRPLLDAGLSATGEDQFLLLPVVGPEELVERDPAALARDLHTLPFAEVKAYLGAIGAALRARPELVRGFAGDAGATSAVDRRLAELTLSILPALLDPDAIGAMVDRELGDGDGSGSRYLDRWVTPPGAQHAGVTARLGARVLGLTAGAAPPVGVRALPTRQLHITAGNSPVVPFVSAVRAFATKGAAVVKSAAECTGPAAMLGAGMLLADPDHPLTRHTSLVYWPGDDRGVEDVLLAAGAFDRVVVWGSAATIASVRGRLGGRPGIYLEPRVGVSLVGREALADGARIRDSAARAVTDSLIANQAACSASLVHYVEGSEEQARAYCEAARDALATWDRAFAHVPERSALRTLNRLRRGLLANAAWFQNGRWPHVSSAVALVDVEFDLAAHPLSRFVVVRRVDDLRDALGFLQRGISVVGVAPEARRLALRDEIVARGVSHVRALGDVERAYPGMPHDGMRVLAELVEWVTA